MDDATERQFQAEVEDRLQREHEEWLFRQDFIHNKDDWIKYSESGSKFDEFMRSRK